MAGVKARLLALSWTMPPLVFPRSLQISRLLRALKGRGWETTVVTVTPNSEPFATLDTELEQFYRDAYRRIAVELGEDEQPSPLWLKAWRRISPPSDQKIDNWVRRVSPVLRNEIRSGDYDALITFAQPWIDHTLGLAMKRAFPKLPWIAHFSDPWVDSAYSHFKNDAEREAALCHERDVIQAADVVIFVNDQTANLVMSKYPSTWRDKVHVIPHGCEPELLSMVTPQPRDARMRITHTGNFYGHRKPDMVLRAVKELSDRIGSPTRLRLQFVGHADDAVRDAAGQLGLADIVTFTGSMSYLDSLRVARSSDLLLLIDAPADTSVFLPSKIVDYLMLGRPILGITPGTGASAEVLRDAGSVVVDPTDYKSILAALSGAFQKWQSGDEAGALPSPSAARAFQIEQVARQFEEAISSVVPKLATSLGPTGRPSLLSIEGVSSVLEMRAQGGRQVTLVLWSADASIAEHLLSLPSVASVILAGPVPDLARRYPGRVGWWDVGSMALTAPGRVARDIFYFIPGKQWRFGVRTTYRLWRQGGRRISLHDADLGITRTTVATRLIAAGMSSLRDRFSRTAIGRKVDEAVHRRCAELVRKHLKRISISPRAAQGKVVLATGSLGPGGSERQMTNTLLGLKDAGVEDLSLIHLHPMVPPHDFFFPILTEAGIPCFHIADEATSGRSTGELSISDRAILQAISRMGVRPDTVLAYLRLFRRWRPDVVHTWLDDTNVTAGLAAVMAGVPNVVLSCRSLAPHRFPFYQAYMRPIYQALAGQSNVRILNNSQAGADDYRAWLGGHVEIDIVLNGFHFDDAEYLAASTSELREIVGVDPSVPLVGTVMRLSSEKQPHLWLDIAELVAATTEAHFVMIGDGPLMTELRARIESSPLKGRMSLLGRRANAARLVAGLDLFVLTSSVEGLPNVLVEAQAHGVPVVSSDVGGVREVFESGETGLLVCPATPEHFAAAVLSILADPAIRRRAKVIGPDLMRRRFSVDRMVTETLSVYRRNKDDTV